MSYDCWLELDGIAGEGTAKGFVGQIEIFSFNWGASAPTTVSAGSGGMSASRVSMSDFHFSKRTDAASAMLLEACCTGKHIAKGKLALRKATGDAQESFIEYKFTDLMVSSFQQAGNQGGDDTPSESIAMVFAEIEFEYKKQSKDGKLTAAGQTGWKLTEIAK